MPTNNKNKTDKKHRDVKKNEKRNNNKGPQVRALTDAEKKRLVTAGAPPSPVKTIVNVTKRAVKAHSDLHKKSKGVRDATKATKPWAMGSMK